MPSGALERGLVLRLRFEFDQYVNLRPVRLFPGVESPLAGPRTSALDILLVREGTECPYIEAGGIVRKGTPMYLVTQPGQFDVIVTDNLFGDVLTALGAAIAGGLGLAASASISPERTGPSTFEPVHGSAQDIAGKQMADPTAAILSAAMLCEHLGMMQAASRIEEAVAEDLLARQGEWAARNTAEIGDDIAERVSGWVSMDGAAAGTCNGALPARERTCDEWADT